MMNTPVKQNLIKRRIIYVDASVQKWLLVALVMLEILLISGALWLLYVQMINTIEANLYRAHAVAKPDIYSLMRVALIGLGGLLIINIAVLWMVDRLWARQLATIIKPLMAMVSKVEMLDFSADAPVTRQHEVVNLAHTWRNTERQRLLNLRAAINQLDVSSEAPTAAQQGQMRATLEAIRKLLP